MRLLTIQALCTVPEHSEITTNAVTLANTNMRERTILPGAATVVGEVDTEGSTFRSRIMRETAGFGGIGTVALKEAPADSYLGWIVLVHAGQPTIAGT